MYEEQMKQFRARAIEKTLRAGLPAYVMDEVWGEGVIRFRTDGVKERIIIVRGKAVVEPVECRAGWR
ncbi:hypothetical protein [Bosea sp. (in: a-proteobacteria)]|uniref:hypothetical protein n=1 Tax=Bosea sp. (in: a-proteobacteria) TaxID=1871050 RepID=UPI002FCC6DAB